MFSANENIALRQHKRRIIQYIEETIPEDVLDLGTTPMVMQVSCKAPGCVPLETVICIVFPKSGAEELLPGLPESANGGTYKTKVLMPMAEVRELDVLEALPPAFKGGKLSMERLCYQARDVMLAQITQLMETKANKKMLAEYLQSCLTEYLERDCEAPAYGEPFSELKKAEEADTTDSVVSAMAEATGNLVIKRKIDDDGK